MFYGPTYTIDKHIYLHILLYRSEDRWERGDRRGSGIGGRRASAKGTGARGADMRGRRCARPAAASPRA
jgi:hypothetical protein